MFSSFTYIFASLFQSRLEIVRENLLGEVLLDWSLYYLSR